MFIDVNTVIHAVISHICRNEICDIEQSKTVIYQPTNNLSAVFRFRFIDIVNILYISLLKINHEEGETSC